MHLQRDMVALNNVNLVSDHDPRSSTFINNLRFGPKATLLSRFVD